MNILEGLTLQVTPSRSSGKSFGADLLLWVLKDLKYAESDRVKTKRLYKYSICGEQA